jgi:translation initiation factor IF-1
MSIYKHIFGVSIFTLLLFLPSQMSAQTETNYDCRTVNVTRIVNGKPLVAPECVRIVKVKSKPKPRKRARDPRGASNWKPAVKDFEKSIAVYEKVIISFCVANASVKVNGWNRSEVRAFVKGREEISFNVRKKNPKNGKPYYVELLGSEEFNNCISGDSVELDIPHNAEVRLKSRSGETSAVVDSVRKANVRINSGDIVISNVKDGVEAATNVGGISTRNCGGKIKLSTTAGNIVAFQTSGSENGDQFTANTHSGSITLQSIEQQEVEISSISGYINYFGTMQEYGKYLLKTTSGIVTLAIPGSSTFKLKAAYGGSFSSEIPLANIEKNATSSIAYLSGIIGKPTGTTVQLISYSGAIRILNSDQPKP